MLTGLGMAEPQGKGLAVKKIIFVLIAAALSSAQTAPPKSRDTVRPVKQYTIEQFLSSTSLTGASFSPDESRILFSSNKTGIWNAYTVPVAGGAWTPVTKSTRDSTYAVSFFPKDQRILMTRDQGATN